MTSPAGATNDETFVITFNSVGPQNAFTAAVDTNPSDQNSTLTGATYDGWTIDSSTETSPGTNATAPTYVNQIDTITISPAVTGGTFAITIGSQTTGSIAYSSNPATEAGLISTAVNALSGVSAVGGVAVASGPNGTYTLSYNNGSTGTTQPTPTFVYNSLSNASTYPVANSTITVPGTGSTNQADTLTFVVGASPAPGGGSRWPSTATPPSPSLTARIPTHWQRASKPL